MKRFDPLDEHTLLHLLSQQQTLAFHEQKDFAWRRGIDLQKPFLPLDDAAIAFPGASSEQRLVISQYMGLMVASVFSEFELAIERLKDACWHPVLKRCSPNPEFAALGEQFFAEEAKHARIFQRFIELFSQHLSMDPEDFKNLLPRVNQQVLDRALRFNSQLHGLALWWVVATVEEESQLIFKQMKPHRDQLDPLYYSLHQKHFEEEARHSSFAFVMLNLGNQASAPAWLRRTDYIFSEVLRTFWLFFELHHSLKLERYKNHHEFFHVLHDLGQGLHAKDFPALIHRLLHKTPYIAAFLNPAFHPHLSREITQWNQFKLPLPAPDPAPLQSP